MATQPAPQAAARAADPLGNLPAKVRKAIDDIRRPFAGFVEDFQQITASREELAPKFMKAYALWSAETDGGTFVDFVRILDPSVGPTRADYRGHAAYQAADYLRRLVATQSRQAGGGGPQQATGPRPAPAGEAIARFIASMIPLLQGDQVNTMFEALSSQLHWTDRQVARIKEMVPDVRPIVVVSQPRGMHALGQLRLSMPHVETEDLARTA